MKKYDVSTVAVKPRTHKILRVLSVRFGKNMNDTIMMILSHSDYHNDINNIDITVNRADLPGQKKFEYWDALRKKNKNF